MGDVFGMGTMVVSVKQVGPADWFRERLNIEVNTSTNWLVHTPGMPSGPGDFTGFTLLKALLTSALHRHRVQSSWSSASLAIGMTLLASKRA